MSSNQLHASLSNEAVKGLDSPSEPGSLFAASAEASPLAMPHVDVSQVEHSSGPLATGSTHATPALPSDLGADLPHMMAMHTEGHGAHPNHPGQQMTHTALLELVPHSAATHVAVQDGSWFDASTWQGGRVPTDGAHVLIEDGVTVTYDDESDTRLETIRVDGTLKFASRVNTKVLVDTFVIAPDGELQIGSKADPVRANVKTQFIFTADGAIDRSTDPTLLGRGLLSHGKVAIYGADKADFLALQTQAQAGDDVLVLKNAPQGWRVGDQIVLGGTGHRYGGSDADNSRFQDEALTIRRIDGNRIYFSNNDITSGDNTVLRFDHQLPDVAEKDQLELYVANTTRNVSFETENADSVPTQQRAHVMFMHNPDVVVENAGFYNLGRSDKSRVVDDPGTNVDGSPGSGNNRRGRYSFHFHRNGADDITGVPAVARGNAIVGSPGWGIVHHDSHAVLEDNVVFDVVGSGIVAESGNEIGVWRNNLTIKTTGVDFENVSRTKDARERRFDLGFKGEGYWVQGAAQVAMLDNVAVSANNAGISIFGDTLNPDTDFRDKETISVSSLPPEIRDRVAPQGQTEVDVTDIPLRQLTGFKSYNARDGILLWGHKTNFDGQLEFNSPEPRTAHDLRSTIDDFAVWGVRGTGVKVQYSSRTDIEDGLIVGAPENPRGTGIFENHASHNIDFRNLTVKGFERGLKLEPLGQDKDFTASSLAGSYFSDNVYNFAPLGENPIQLNNRLLPDDFRESFKIINTRFVTPENNADPVARFNTRAVGGLAVAFDASASSDRDPLQPESRTLTGDFASNAIASYGWDFNNDGRIDAFGRQVSHHFSKTGPQQVSVTVWDNQGATNTLTKTIDVQPSDYVNPFIDGNFSSRDSFEEGYKASSLGADLAWLASNGVRRGDGGAILSDPNHYGAGIAQVLQNNKIHRGKQTLGLRLKNTEGSGKINNDIEIVLWGVNGQFKNKIYEKAQPYQAGTLPMQRAKLADITLGGENFDWKNFQWNVDLKNGYQFLLLQVNTKGSNNPGDYVGIDNVRLFGDGTSTPTSSPIPVGDNRYFLRGTAANELFIGSERSQLLHGEEGNDILKARGGDDSLAGGKGRDTLKGEGGDDRLYGEAGDDFVGGGDGNDSLYAGEGNDRLIGWKGDDNLYGDAGNDSLSGSIGDDTLNGAEGRDTLRGDAGDDKLGGQAGDDLLGGGDGNDSLYAGEGNDRLIGWKGDDNLYGDVGNDSLNGNDGNDTLNGADGKDYLQGGAGRDLLNGGLGDDTVLGGSDNDTLYGSEGKDLLRGQSGDDILHGGEDDDQLFGGSGQDSLYAGAGNDVLTGGQGSDSLRGAEGNDRIVGVDVSSLQAGRGEQDLLVDWDGNDVFVLGDANRVYYNDGRSNTQGRGDFAMIQGFKQGQGDTIQLHGKASDYRLGAIPQGIDLQNGTGLYLQTAGTDELVAVLAYENNADLTSDSFVYV